MKFIFELSPALKALLNHAVQNRGQAIRPYAGSIEGVLATPLQCPCLYLVKDEGVYLMSADKVIDPKNPDRTGRLTWKDAGLQKIGESLGKLPDWPVCIYADGYERVHLPGDDFVELIEFDDLLSSKKRFNRIEITLTETEIKTELKYCR